MKLKKNHIFNLLFFTITIGLFCHLPTIATAEGLGFTYGIPKEFQNISAEREVFVELSYGSHMIGSTQAIITPQTIKLLTPEEFIHRIPNLIDPNIIQEALRKEMQQNAHLICQKKNKNRMTQCGRVENVKIIEIIYDDRTMKGNLFINPNFLTVQEVENTKFLPLPSTGFSSIFRIGGAAVSDEEGEETYTLSGHSVLSYNENYISAHSSYSDIAGFTVEELYGQRHVEDIKYTAGFFPVRNISSIGQPGILGIDISRSLKTRLDLEHSLGTQIQVFLANRSRVILKKDGKILSSNFYEAGNQMLDTSRLPSGAYDVEIEIIDEIGNKETKSEFFVKSNEIPPVDTTLFSVGAGYLEDKSRDDRDTLPAYYEDIPIAYMGGAIRLGTMLALSSDVLYSEEETFFELGLNILGEKYTINTDFLGTSNADYGATLRINSEYSALRNNLTIRKIWKGDGESTSILSNINANELSGTLSSSYNIGRTTINLRANAKKTGENDITYAYGPDIRHNISYSKGFLTSIGTSATKTEDELRIMANLSISYSKDKWYLKSALRHQSTERNVDGQEETEKDTSLASTNSISWKDGHTFSGDLSTDLQYTNTDGDSRESIGLSYASGDFGALRLNAQNTDSGRRYNGEFFFNLVGNKDDFAFGGKNHGQSAVIIDIDTPTGNNDFEVLINNAVRDTVSSKSRTPIILNPYRTYNVEIRSLGNAGTSILDYDATPKPVTLYPGNVSILKWQPKEIVILVGTVVDMLNKPIQNAVIKNKFSWAVTEEDGSFQISAYKDKKIEVKKENGEICFIEFNENQKTENGVLFAGKLPCHTEKEKEAAADTVILEGNLKSISGAPLSYYVGELKYIEEPTLPKKIFSTNRKGGFRIPYMNVGRYQLQLYKFPDVTYKLVIPELRKKEGFYHIGDLLFRVNDDKSKYNKYHNKYYNKNFFEGDWEIPQSRIMVPSTEQVSQSKAISPSTEQAPESNMIPSKKTTAEGHTPATQILKSPPSKTKKTRMTKERIKRKQKKREGPVPYFIVHPNKIPGRDRRIPTP
ncbi:MAG: CS1-pili formation C-terminal domain-containing protein [Alphaproteobacteria bacterium]